jgi:hypothetical protein
VLNLSQNNQQYEGAGRSNADSNIKEFGLVVKGWNMASVPFQLIDYNF